MQMNSTKLGAIFVSIAAAMWGFDGVVLTPRLWNLNVSYVVFMLHALPFIGMNAVLFKEYRVLKTLDMHDKLYFFLVALFGGALGTLAIVKALFIVQFQSLTVVALLQKLQPIFAIVLARVLLKEKISNNFVLWAGVSILGGYFLTFELKLPTLVEKGKMLPAAFYAVLAAFSFGSATVFGKRVLHKVSFQTALFYRYGITTLIMLAVILVNGNYDQLHQTTPANWLFFVIIGLTTGSGAILLYYYGLKSIQANVSTICELWFPVSTVLFDYLVNGNVLSPMQWVSAGIMVFAIYRISSSQAEDTEVVCEPTELCKATG